MLSILFHIGLHTVAFFKEVRYDIRLRDKYPVTWTRFCGVLLSVQPHRRDRRIKSHDKLFDQCLAESGARVEGPDRGWGPFETSMYVNAGGTMGRAISMLHTKWVSLCINILSYQPTSDRLTRTTSPITPFEWVAPNRGGLSLLMLLVARTSSE